MGFADKFNRFDWGYDTSNLTKDDYKSLEELYDEDGAGTIYPVYGLFVNKKGKFDDYPVAISNGFYINLPAHLLETYNEIMADSSAIADIKAHKVGLSVYTYEQKEYNKTCYSIKWHDGAPGDFDSDQNFGLPY